MLLWFTCQVEQIGRVSHNEQHMPKKLEKIILVNKILIDIQYSKSTMPYSNTKPLHQLLEQMSGLWPSLFSLQVVCFLKLVTKVGWWHDAIYYNCFKQLNFKLMTKVYIETSGLYRNQMLLQSSLSLAICWWVPADRSSQRHLSSNWSPVVMQKHLLTQIHSEF